MKKYICLFLFFVLSALQLQAGGPWTQTKGQGYFKLSEWWIVFDQHYTDQGKLDPNLTNGIFNTTLYAEYGLTDRLTAIAYAPIFSRNYMNNLVSLTTNDIIIPGEAINSIGDIDLSLKYALTKPGSKIPIAASLLLGLPLGKTGGGSLGNLQTGDGEFNQLLRLDAGTGFNSSYVASYVGVNNRTEGYSDEFRYGLEYGVNLAKSKLWLIARLDGVESFKNGDSNQAITSTSIFANNSEFTSVSIEAAFYIGKQFGISASAASAFRGEIIAAAPSYSVGVFLDLSK